MSNYYMPTRLVMGKGCVLESSGLFKNFGRKAVIVTGFKSAEINGSRFDVEKALSSEGIDYAVYNKVIPNPTYECIRDGAEFIKTENADFIIAIGGGSPIDAAKAMGLMVYGNLDYMGLFKGNYTGSLPIIAIPTTAGTGTEVTPYAIVTDHEKETKVGIASPYIFPQISFMDATYMVHLPAEQTLNTTVDAMSHAIEGMLSFKGSLLTDELSRRSISMIVKLLPKMIEDSTALTFEDREQLLYASTLAGMVIAQTGTTVLHALGYALTYHHQVDHGKANGIILAEYLRYVQKVTPKRAEKVLEAMNVNSINEVDGLMRKIFKELPKITEQDMEAYAYGTLKTGNMNNCEVKPGKEALVRVYKKALL